MSSPYKTVAFQTLGCKLNFSETSIIAQDFQSKGYAKVGTHDIADIYVINTCSVTENANKKAKKAIRQASNLNSRRMFFIHNIFIYFRFQNDTSSRTSINSNL